MSGDSTKLSSSVTVTKYRALEKADNRKALGAFIIERFNERYFIPVETSSQKHGFAMLAVCCLVVEALESFYQGKADTKGKSREMFESFFNRDTQLKVFAGENDWFYYQIRCGILHQAETRGGWRIWRKGVLRDSEKRTINANKFLQELKCEVEKYAGLLETNCEAWINFKRKMKAVCENCNTSSS